MIKDYLLNLFSISKKSKNRIGGLDATRGLAAIMVFLFHFLGSHSGPKKHFYTDNKLLQSVTRYFYPHFIGVNVFFVLSGFLMWYVYSKRRLDFKEFMARRVDRLLPTYGLFLLAYLNLHKDAVTQIVSLIIYVVSYVLIAHFGYFKRVIAWIFRNFLFLQITLFTLLLIALKTPFLSGSFPDTYSLLSRGKIRLVTYFANLANLQYFFEEVPVLSFVAWAIVAEQILYMLFWLFNYLSGRYGSKFSAFYKVNFVLFFFAVSILLHAQTKIGARLGMGRYVAFVFGVLLGWFYSEERGLFDRFSKYVKALHIIPLFLLFYIGIAWPSFYRNMTSRLSFHLLADVVIFVFVYAILVEGSLISKILNSRFFRFIGAISYSVFLSHIFVITSLRRFFRAWSFGTMIIHFLLSFVVTILLSSITYVFLERPRLIRSGG